MGVGDTMISSKPNPYCVLFSTFGESSRITTVAEWQKKTTWFTKSRETFLKTTWLGEQLYKCIGAVRGYIVLKRNDWMNFKFLNGPAKSSSFYHLLYGQKSIYKNIYVTQQNYKRQTNPSVYLYGYIRCTVTHYMRFNNRNFRQIRCRIQCEKLTNVHVYLVNNGLNVTYNMYTHLTN